jgi:hypothetical protein
LRKRGATLLMDIGVDKKGSANYGKYKKQENENNNQKN